MSRAATVKEREAAPLPDGRGSAEFSIMDNHIRQIEIHDRSLVPAEAEMWITIVAERQTPTTELRGRLMGPRCPYANTVEVAYPLRPLPPGRASESSALTRRVVIPEACLWEPESPFLYQGPIELWQDGQRCDRLMLSHGLRSFHLDERGLRVNGRPLRLRGRSVTVCTEKDALALRQAGYNLLIAPVEEGALPLWEHADRLGFLMLVRVPKDGQPARQHLEILSRHASCLGWLVEEGEHPSFHLLPRTGLVGLMCESSPRDSSLSRADFVFGPAELANFGKPLLVKGEGLVEPPEAARILGSAG
ncbi:MAG TPA: hypothetical protein VH682_07840 [Gemmataceae bacterium]|jgi:hypothetical protein